MSEFNQTGFYLGQNMDILACAAGYTRNQFLAEIGIHPSTYTCRCLRGLPLSDQHVEKIGKYIKGLEHPFLTYIYEEACTKFLERFDIFQTEGGELENKSCRTILKTNLKALRYFLWIDQLSLAKMSSCCRSTIQNIEDGRCDVSESMCCYIYKALEKEATKQGPEATRIFKIGSNYEITTKIPSNFRC